MTRDRLEDRLAEAAKAKKARIEKARAAAPGNDPEAIERRQARLEAAVARDARKAERKATKAADAKRKAEEEAAAKLAHDEAVKAEQAARIAGEAALEIERKAGRDARYAARKARQR